MSALKTSTALLLAAALLFQAACKQNYIISVLTEI